MDERSSIPRHPPIATDKLMDSPDLDLRMIRKAEAIIRWRCTSIVVVVERCVNDHNYSAILRTAEALGLQHVWMIDPPQGETPLKENIQLSEEEKKSRAEHRLFAKKATEWLELRDFATTTDCIDALRTEGYQMWVTDLSQHAVAMTPEDLSVVDQWPMPEKLAIVFGTEAVGVSQELLDAANLRVYLPLRGFADSLNLSVAAALVLQQLLVWEPHRIGDATESERRKLREIWFAKLAEQRLYSAKDKRLQKRLQSKLYHAQDLLQLPTDALSDAQREKLSQIPNWENELESLRIPPEVVQRAIHEWVESPPDPLTDVRRADHHRVCFVGKNTRQNNAEHWKDMAATTYEKTTPMSSAAAFRERVQGSS